MKQSMKRIPLRFPVPDEWRETVSAPPEMFETAGFSVSDAVEYFDASVLGLLGAFRCRAMGGSVVSLVMGRSEDEADVFFADRSDVAKAAERLERFGYRVRHKTDRACLMKRVADFPAFGYVHLVDNSMFENEEDRDGKGRPFNPGSFDRFDLFASKISVSMEGGVLCARGFLENVRNKCVSVDTERFYNGDRVASWAATVKRVAKYVSLKGFSSFDGTFFDMLSIVAENVAGDTLNGVAKSCLISMYFDHAAECLFADPVNAPFTKKSDSFLSFFRELSAKRRLRAPGDGRTRRLSSVNNIYERDRFRSPEWNLRERFLEIHRTIPSSHGEPTPIQRRAWGSA